MNVTIVGNSYNNNGGGYANPTYREVTNPGIDICETGGSPYVFTKNALQFGITYEIFFLNNNMYLYKRKFEIFFKP